MSFENPRNINELEQATSAEKNAVKRITYNLESGAMIEISYREFDATHKDTDDIPEGNRERAAAVATIFLPGWAMGADTESARKLGEEFADSSKNSTYAIST